ncbi:MAG TPA: carboxypeptidase-like regulatory domain-containing protein, partial [Arenibacter sp.]|nr:carboxypeptidase-like regulatory domain-containing protein [Arenibacter sp.]
MKKKLHFLIIAWALLCLNGVMAQTRTLSGTVTDVNDGSPLPGVSILVQGTQKGAQTDFDGNFSLEAATGDKLVFSYLGMKTQTITVGNSNIVNISMEE